MKQTGGMRAELRALMDYAAQAGLACAWKLGDMTPREIELEMRAEAERRRLRMEEADLAAWLTGRYVLTAMHAPRRYPARPNGIQNRRRQMTDDEMKRFFQGMTKERRVEDGGC